MSNETDYQEIGELPEEAPMDVDNETLLDPETYRVGIDELKARGVRIYYENIIDRKATVSIKNNPC